MTPSRAPWRRSPMRRRRTKSASAAVARAEQVAEQARAAGAPSPAPPTPGGRRWPGRARGSRSTGSSAGGGSTARRVAQPDADLALPGPADQEATAGSTSSGASRRSRSARLATFAEPGPGGGHRGRRPHHLGQQHRPNGRRRGAELAPCASSSPPPRDGATSTRWCPWPGRSSIGATRWRGPLTAEVAPRLERGGIHRSPRRPVARREFRRGHAAVPGDPGPAPDRASQRLLPPASSGRSRLRRCSPTCCPSPARSSRTVLVCDQAELAGPIVAARPGRPQRHPLLRRADPRHPSGRCGPGGGPGLGGPRPRPPPLRRHLRPPLPGHLPAEHEGGGRTPTSRSPSSCARRRSSPARRCRCRR